ncbi:hypothetical protein [Pseudomonas sp. Irchel 3E13]|uniref:hypothetical protein n=1 Tax=Pseudomonas sp. Irchel 3E13 TaxID=2008975 RepID=UPI00117ACC8E|nr:hypothetical protein [Pseudomonas sp. Irchel 3E13]
MLAAPKAIHSLNCGLRPFGHQLFNSNQINPCGSLPAWGAARDLLWSLSMKNFQFLVLAGIVLSGCIEMRPIGRIPPEVEASTAPVCQQNGGVYDCRWVKLTPQLAIPVQASTSRIVF